MFWDTAAGVYDVFVNVTIITYLYIIFKFCGE